MSVMISGGEIKSFATYRLQRAAIVTFAFGTCASEAATCEAGLARTSGVAGGVAVVFAALASRPHKQKAFSE